jgi:hypothetical protein
MEMSGDFAAMQTNLPASKNAVEPCKAKKLGYAFGDVEMKNAP